MDFTDLQKKAIKIKEKYHELELKKYGKKWTREQCVSGLVVDIGELVELSMVESGIRDRKNIDHQMAHELADCLYSIFTIADEYKVDLEKSFLELCDHLDDKINNQLKN